METQFLALLKYPFKTHTSILTWILYKLSGFNFLTPHEAIYVGSVGAANLTYKSAHKEKDFNSLARFTRSFFCYFDNVPILKELLDKDPSQNDYSEYYFSKACERGHLNVAKWLWNTMLSNQTNCRVDYDYVFVLACFNGHLHVVQWLYDVNPQIRQNRYTLIEAFVNTCSTLHIHVIVWLTKNNYDPPTCLRGFENACVRGHLCTVQWLWSKYHFHIPRYIYIDALYNACIRGQFLMVKWLWKVKPDDYPGFDDKHFSVACENGHLRLAQWLWGLDIDRPSHNTLNHAFQWACMNGKFHVVSWLWDLGIFTRLVCDDELFFGVCAWGYLHVAQWLWNIKSPKHPDHRMDDDRIFRMVCENDDIHMAKWLWELGSSTNSIKYRYMHDKSFRKRLHFPHSHDVNNWLDKVQKHVHLTPQ